MIPLDSIIVPLSAALGLAVVIERILEFAKNVLEPVLVGQEGRQPPDLRQAEQAVKELESLHQQDKDFAAAEANVLRQQERRIDLQNKLSQTKSELERATDPADRTELERKSGDLAKRLAEVTEALTAETQVVEWDERVSTSTMLVEPATDPDDGRALKRFILQFLGFAIGIISARIAGVQLFNVFFAATTGAPVPVIAPWSDYVLTGLLIGGGSGPVHVLIRFVTQRKVSGAEPVASEEAQIREPSRPAAPAPAAPAVITAPSEPSLNEWVEIPYEGGVDRGKLEGLHRRKKDPDLVVYHHTAMNSLSTFDDVVKVIKSRKDSKGNRWITGYNCVVLADGSIHPFCRWDRYGNHAAGYNMRSLGITFNGNFETNPSVPFSNPDGRYGPPRPTEAQVKSGACVVALWTILYQIDPNFSKTIIPHKAIADKACPGNNFPYAEFQRWVEFFRERWRSGAAKERIEAFKLKPYLFVNR